MFRMNNQNVQKHHGHCDFAAFLARRQLQQEFAQIFSRIQIVSFYIDPGTRGPQDCVVQALVQVWITDG